MVSTTNYFHHLLFHDIHQCGGLESMVAEREVEERHDVFFAMWLENHVTRVSL